MMRSVTYIVAAIVVVVVLCFVSDVNIGYKEVRAIVCVLCALMNVKNNSKFIFRLQSIRRQITVLIYETESMDETPANHLVQHISRLEGFDAYVFGNGQGFEGYGSKYAAAYPILKELPADNLVVISDGRDVLLNNPLSTDRYSKTAAIEFRKAFDTLIGGSKEGAVVVSAEAKCCVSALTHATPGSYYNEDGSRNERACPSGEEDCLFKGDTFALPWETFMKSLAIERSKNNEVYDDVYLNAGLMVGTTKDLLRLIERAEIGKDEDDQAVLTDFMYHNPNAIVLDYGQTLFGNNRGGFYNNALSYEENKDSTCMFHLPENDSHNRLHHSKTNTSPLFVHSPGGYLRCHDDLVHKLGYASIAAKARRRLMGSSWVGERSGCNYARICLGSHRGYLGLGFGQEKPRFIQRFNNHN
jgi:hypothetical protein